MAEKTAEQDRRRTLEAKGAGSATSDVHDRSLAYWSGRAPEYSRLHEDELASERGASLAAVLEGLPKAVPGARVLDLGCGSGLLSIVLAGKGCAVTGVDFSADMLEQARANTAAHGVGANATFVQADVHELPFEDGSFDLVVTRNVTWVLQDVTRVYAHALRVLVPGGMFVNIDANYGRTFREAEERGETPTHPTQTLEQLRNRNDIVRDLPISHVDRPLWDISTLWGLGASYVGCHRNFDALLAGGVAAGAPYSSASARRKSELFMLEAVK